MKRRATVLMVGVAVLFTYAQADDPKWVETAGPHGGRVYSLVVCETNIFAGTELGGVYISMDNGDSWSTTNAGLPRSAPVFYLVVSGADLFARTSRGVFLSSDNGKSWIARSAGLPEDISVGCLAVLGTHLFVGSPKGVFRSADNGITWKAVSSGLPKNTYVSDIAVSGENVFVGTASAIFLSTDSGATWRNVSSGFPSKANLWCLVPSGTDVFAGTVHRSVLRFTQKDKKWSAARAGIPETEIHCFATNGTDLFAGTGGGLDAIITKEGIKQIPWGEGVFRSTDSGKNWSAINWGLPIIQTPAGTFVGTYIECLAVSETHLFAATREGIVWRLPLKDLPAK